MQKNFSKLILFLCLSISTIFLSGCGGDGSKDIAAPDFYTPKSTDSENAKADVDVYFDATISMKGYTTLAAGNVYRTLPDILDAIGTSMGKASFFKFGKEVTPIDNREHKKFSSQEPYIELVTAVHNVVDYANPDHLTVIVTDLFESEADWSNITKKIREKYFANHKAVAVIGVKNSFNGEIFDVGLNAAKFNYNSYDDPNRFRPFYLLILGDEAPVKNFMERFKDVQTLNNNTGYLLLSENLTETTIDFAKMALEEIEMENFFAETKLDIVSKGVREFGIDSFSSPAMFTVNFDYKEPLGACQLNLDEMTQDVRIFALDYDNGEWQELEENDVKIEVAAVEGEQNKFAAKFSMTPDKSLERGKINFVHAALVPTAKGYQLPQWVRNWNMANVDVAPGNFDGSKTINLIHVLNALKDAVFDTTRPAMIEFNFFVDAR